MKVQFEKKELIKAVSKAGKIAFSYKTNELYNNLKITCNDFASFKINNDIAFLETSVKCKTIEPGEICINPCIFVSIINSLNSDTLEFESNESTLFIKGRNTEIRLSLLNRDNFIKGPDLKNIEVEQSFELNNEILKDAFLNCLPFENTKSIISGLNFKSNQDGKLRLCCCSELSACLYSIEDIKLEKDKDIDFTLNTRFLKEFKDIFDEKILKISIYKGFLNIKDKNTSLSFRFLTKSFPYIEKIVPTSFEKELPIFKSSFEQAFDLMDVMTKNIDATIEYKENKCKISHKEGVCVEVDVDSNIEESLKIEREQLRKVLRLINKENIVLFFNKCPKPIVIKEDNKIFLISVLVK